MGNPVQDGIRLLSMTLGFLYVSEFDLLFNLWHMISNYLWKCKSEEWMLTWLLT